MAVLLDAQGTYLAGATTNQAVVSAPAGLAAGKLPIVILEMEDRVGNNGSAIVPVDAGWTLYDPAALGYTYGLTTPSTSAMYCRVYHYEPRGTPSSWTFNWTGSTWRAAKAVSFTGAAATGSPFRYGGAGSMASTALTTANATPPVTFTGFVTDDYGLFTFVHFNGWAAGVEVMTDATPETDWTFLNFADGTSPAKGIGLAAKTRTSSGDLTNFTVPTHRNGEQIAMMLSIPPAAGGPAFTPKRFVQSRASRVRASTY